MGFVHHPCLIGGNVPQLCFLRFPGQGLLPDAAVPTPLLQWIARELRLDPACWPQYAEREETRREHLLELRAYLGVEPFGLAHYRQAVHATTDLALQTDKGLVLAVSVLDTLRRRHIILPTLDVIERVCAEAITRANRRIYAALSEPLSNGHRHRLDELLKRRDNGKRGQLTKRKLKHAKGFAVVLVLCWPESGTPLLVQSVAHTLHRQPARSRPARHLELSGGRLILAILGCQR